MTQLISDRPQGASIRLTYPPVLLAHLLGLYLSVVFVFYVVAPTIDQQTLVLDSRFLFDSIAYLKHSHGIPSARSFPCTSTTPAAASFRRSD